MSESQAHDAHMPVRAALQVLIQGRTSRQIVVTNQGSSRVWPLLDTCELDLHYNPSTMGGAVPLALGLAIGLPNYEVIVVTGDGALLMSLGSLVTVAAQRPSNLTIIVMDNGRYEVTGGQRTAGGIAQTNFAQLAHQCGVPQVDSFCQLDAWRKAWPKPLDVPGPRLVALRVAEAEAADLATSTPPILDQLSRLQHAVQAQNVPPESLDGTPRTK